MSKSQSNDRETVWWDSLTVLRTMEVGDIAELADGTYGKVEKFGQGVFIAWEETEPKNACWVFVNGVWHHHRDLFFKSDCENYKPMWPYQRIKGGHL